MGNKMKNMALELEREMGVFFNISGDRVTLVNIFG